VFARVLADATAAAAHDDGDANAEKHCRKDPVPPPHDDATIQQRVAHGGRMA
jgi:hypothetical protein